MSVAVYGVLLFVPAGTLNWPRAWVLLSVIFTALIATRLSMEDEGALVERRKAPFQHGQPRADQLLVIGFLIVFPAYLILIPLDVFYLHLLGPPNEFVSALGLVLLVAGSATVSLAFRANAFAAGIVKDQRERGQVVVDRGPYALVRHPFYAGVILITLGAALWLESYSAALAAVVPIGLLLVRIAVEERFLRSRLSGYDAYAARVRQRLIPGLW